MSSGSGRLGRHLNQRMSRITSRLDDHKLLLGLIVAAAGAFLAYVAFVSTTGPPFQSRYEIQVQVPSDAPVLRSGQAVRIGGKLAGLVSSVEPDRENSGTLVTANITKPQFRPVGTNARANVRVHSIVYHTYLEIYPGDTSDPMPDNGTIPQDRVSSGVDLLEVVQLFDHEARQSLRETVVNLGSGVAGRGDELNDALGDVGPTARNLLPQLRAFNREPGALAGLVADSARLTGALEGRRTDDVESTLVSGSSAVATIAERRDDLGAALRLLRPFEDELIATAPIAVPLFDDLTVAAGDLRPAVRGLNAALPEINELLGLGGTLLAETRRITDVTEPVLRSTRPLLVEVYPTLAALDPLLADVNTVVDTVGPYGADIRRAGIGLAETTAVRFPQGRGPGANAPMGRVIPIVTCHSNRNPLPEPGGALKDSKAC